MTFFRPSRPSPGRIRVVALGDSHIAKNNYGKDTGALLSNELRGELTWAKFYEPRIVFHSLYNQGDSKGEGQRFIGMNQGVGGETSTQIAARFGVALALQPDVLFLGATNNDYNITNLAAHPYETIISNYDRIVSAALALGLPVIFATVAPRPSSVYARASDAWLRQKRVNSWIRQQRRRKGVLVFDRCFFLTNLTDSVGEPISGYIDSTDDAHFTPPAGRVLGYQLSKIVQGLFPGLPYNYATTPDDIYDATYNPAGNFLGSKGFFLGTSGTAQTGVTGNIATGWTAVLATGSVTSCVGSIETDPVYGRLQVLTYALPGGGTGNETYQLNISSSPAANSVAGEWVQGSAFIRIPATPSLVEFSLQMRNNVNAGLNFYAMRNDDVTDNRFPNADVEGWIATEPFLVPASPSTWTFRFNTTLPAADTATVVIKVGAAGLRKIDAPTGGTNPMWTA